MEKKIAVFIGGAGVGKAELAKARVLAEQNNIEIVDLPDKNPFHKIQNGSMSDALINGLTDTRILLEKLDSQFTDYSSVRNESKHKQTCQKNKLKRKKRNRRNKK